MNKSILKRLILEKQTDIPKLELVHRSIVLEPKLNYVFVGLRRAGKSYLMYQLIQHAIKQGEMKIEDVLYINFEDERIALISAQELGLILDAYSEMYDGQPVVFLDEIQNVKGWEKFARRLADARYRVYITGSNAQMLSKDIYTTLGGRYLAYEVYPFSFAEYLRYKSVVLNKNWEYSDLARHVKKLFLEYFYSGGFAESFVVNDKRSWLNALYQKILLGDIITRNDIRSENAIRVLVKKLSESVMQPSSLSRLKNIVDTTGTTIARNTMVDYLQYLSDSYLIFGISNFTDKLSEKETFKKRYFFDNGLLNNFLFDPDTKLLENIVAIHLKKKWGDDLYYYNRNIELDFFNPKRGIAIQVCYDISNHDTFQRETKALLKISEMYEVNEFLIITFDTEMQINENNINIVVLPVWKWLLLDN